MSRKLVPDYRQKEKIAALVDELGVKVYREAKAALGLGRMKPFQKLNYAEAMQVIGMLESLRKERFGGQGENGTISHSHQSRLLQPAAVGLAEPAGERSER